MKPGLYSVSYKPFSVITGTNTEVTDTVIVSEQGLHYMLSAVDGRYHKTFPYGTEAQGYAWTLLDADMTIEKYERQSVSAG